MCKFARLRARVRVCVHGRMRGEYAVTCIHIVDALSGAMCEVVYAIH